MIADNSTIEDRVLRAGDFFLNLLSEYDPSGPEIFLKALSEVNPSLARKFTLQLLTSRSVPSRLSLKISNPSNFSHAVEFIKLVRSSFNIGLYESKQIYDAARNGIVELDCSRISIEEYLLFNDKVSKMGVLIL